MKKKYIRYNYLLLILLSIVAILQLLPFLKINICSGDDLEYYTAVLSGENPIERAWIYAKGQGRFFSIFNCWQSALAYMGNNIVLSKSLQYGFILLNIILLGILLKRVFKSNWVAYLFVLCMLAFLPISPYTNPFICYPLLFSVHFSIFLGSLLFLCHYFKTRTSIYLYLSGLFYFIALLNYEVYVVFIIIPLLLIVFNNFQTLEFAFKTSQKQDKKHFTHLFSKKTLLNSLAYIVPLVIYLICYWGFRQIYPSDYGGSSFSNDFSISKALQILINFNKTTLPGYVFFSEIDLVKNYFPLLKTHSLFFVGITLKSILILFLLHQLLIHIKQIPYRKLSMGIVLSFVALFLPHILLSITEKYQMYATSFKGYVSTYWSFFAMACFICFILIGIHQYIKPHKSLRIAFLGVLYTVFISISILTSISNECLSKDYQLSNARLNAVAVFCASEQGKTLKAHSLLYAPSLWETSSIYGAGLTSMHTEICFQNYMQALLHRPVFVCRTEEKIIEYQLSYPLAEIYHLHFVEDTINLRGELICIPN